MAGNISDQTTVLSNLSLERNLSSNSLIVGGAQAMTRFSAGTITVATIAAPNATSSTTTAAVSGLSTVDLIVVGPTSSGLSAGLSLTAFSSGSGIATLVFLNGSASTVTQATGTYRWTSIRAPG